jgi:hypothetical protein
VAIAGQFCFYSLHNSDPARDAERMGRNSAGVKLYSSKGDKQIERCVISTFQVAERMGLKGGHSPVGTPVEDW